MIFDTHYVDDYWHCRFLDYRLVGDAKTGRFDVSRFLGGRKCELWLADDDTRRLIRRYGDVHETKEGTFAREEFLFSAVHWLSHDPSTIEAYENDVPFECSPSDPRLHGVLVVLKTNASEYRLLRTQRQSVKSAIKKVCLTRPRTTVVYATRHPTPVYFANALHHFPKVVLRGNRLELLYPEEEFLRDLRAAVASDISRYEERYGRRA